MTRRPRRSSRRPDERHPEPAPNFTHGDFVKFVESHPWTFAKTMAHMPHEWIKRADMKTKDRQLSLLETESDSDTPNEDAFEAAVLFIREHGYVRRFGARAYTYYDVEAPDGTWHQYWTMGAPMVRTIIMNRARVKPAPSGTAGFHDSA